MVARHFISKGHEILEARYDRYPRLLGRVDDGGIARTSAHMESTGNEVPTRKVGNLEGL